MQNYSTVSELFLRALLFDHNFYLTVSSLIEFFDKFKFALIESRYNKYSDEQDKSIMPIVNFVNVSNHE